MSLTSEQSPGLTFNPGPHELRPRPATARRPPAARLALAQGAYFLFSGLFARKRLMVANIGAALALAGARGKVSRELQILGAASAATLAAIDFHKSRRFDLIDGALQLATVALWGLATLRDLRETQRPPEPAFA